jgi:hypothetical protein
LAGVGLPGRVCPTVHGVHGQRVFVVPCYLGSLPVQEGVLTKLEQKAETGWLRLDACIYGQPIEYQRQCPRTCAT